MTLRIHLLGPLRAFEADRPIRLPPRARLTSLWAYLLVRREVSQRAVSTT